MNKITSSKNKVLFAGIIFWVIIGIMYSIILTSVLSKYNLTTMEICLDAVVNNLLLTGGCVLIFNNMRYYLPRREKYWYILTISFALSLISYYVAKGTLLLVFKGDSNYWNTYNDTSSIRFSILFLMITCMAMMSLLLFTQEEEQTMNERRADMEKLSKEAELFKLRQQLQPHFLFNSLNSISALTGSQPEKARHMIQQLSDFLRGTLKREEQHWNTLEEEIQYLRLYLDIEKVRFGHRLQTEITYNDAVLNYKLPALLLQPVVENAIKFGLYDTTGEVIIKLAATIEDNYLKIWLQNPFDPETALPNAGTGFGLSSIQRRLFLLFARQDLLKTEKDQTHFITTILIPQSL